MSDDDILNSQKSNKDLWGDSDVAEFFNENSNRLMNNQVPISAAQQDRSEEKNESEADIEQREKENERVSVIKEKLNNQVTTGIYKRIENQIKDEDSGKA